MGALSAVFALARFAGSLLAFAANCAYFRRPYRWLPKDLEPGSAVYLAITALYFGAGTLRHFAVAGHKASAVLFALAFHLGLLAVLAVRLRRGAQERSAGLAAMELLALYLGVSIGVDLTASAVGAIWGLGAAGYLVMASSVWELAAIVWITALHRAQPEENKPTRAEKAP